MMIFIAKKLLLDREITSLDFNIFKDQSNTQLKSFNCGYISEKMKFGARRKTSGCKKNFYSTNSKFRQLKKY